MNDSRKTIAARLVTIQFLADKYKVDRQTLSRAIDTGRTSVKAVQSAMKDMGIHVDLIQPGSWWRNRPVLKTANAFNGFAESRRKRG